jgi:hypothetical protein
MHRAKASLLSKNVQFSTCFIKLLRGHYYEHKDNNKYRSIIINKCNTMHNGAQYNGRMF